MPHNRQGRRLASLVALSAAALLGGAAHADDRGFQLDRYEPTSAGEWFFAAESPWYSRYRSFAGGLTLDYGHNPLVYGARTPNGDFSQSAVVVAHQLVGHVDLAASLFDRVLVSLTLPVTLYEGGNAIGGTGPADFGVGDPRLGAMLRVYNRAERDAFSAHIGVDLWIPVGDPKQNLGDNGVRLLPKLVLAGFVDGLRWAFNAGYLVRSQATLAGLPAAAGNTVAQEIQLAAAIGYANPTQTFNVGPELTLATNPDHAFDRDYTSIEILLGAHYLAAESVLFGLGAGVGILREPGTPDVRLLARVAYAPRNRETAAKVVDSDGDGIPDVEDACPFDKGPRTNDPKTNGCPPVSDRDHDGVPDKDDLCPDVPKGDHPDPERLGCPEKDTDGDGVFDREDQCPEVPMGKHPDPKRLGCPDKDTDNDCIYDSEDQCPEVPAGLHPDPDHKGCPLPDRDHDSIPDAVDACPDQPGAPDPDPKKNGCPGLVRIQNGMIVILQPVYFATDKAVILPKSGPLLKAVAYSLQSNPRIKRLSVEGHTDSRGSAEYNLDLSERRADSVRRWLIEQGGVTDDRLESHGYGLTRPVSSNLTNNGRAANRRVEFRIVDPAMGGTTPTPAPTPDPVPKPDPNKKPVPAPTPNPMPNCPT